MKFTPRLNSIGIVGLLAAVYVTFFCFTPIAFGAVTKTKNEKQTALAFEKGYVFAPMAGSTATAGYGTLVNTSKKTLEITALNSTTFKAAEMHETKEENGLMKMKKLVKLTLKPGERFELKPGGNHLMLFEATPGLKPGDTVTLTFESNEGPLAVIAATVARTTSNEPSASAQKEAHAHHH